MAFEIPGKAFQNDTVYHQFGADYTNLFGCGFLNKTGKACREDKNVYKHYAAVLVLSGEGVHVDEEGRETPLGPGCLIQRIPDKQQSLLIKPDGKWLEFFICIGKDMYWSLLSMELLDSRQNILYPGLNRAVFEQFQEFLNLMKETHPAEINMLIPEALKIILMLHRLHRENAGNSKDREVIRKACLLLTGAGVKEISIPGIAKELGMGYEKFRKLFKEQVGVSPGTYSLQKRMDAARSLLMDKNRNMKEIAVDLGFSDSYAFSKQFKSIVGISPSEYRKIH